MFGLSRKPARLGQWDGRQRSSRCDTPCWADLWHKPTLSRLLIVLATAVLVTLLAYLHGPPLPYRVGEKCDHDLRVRVSFTMINEAHTARLRDEQEARVQILREHGHTVEDPPPVVPIIDHYLTGLLLVKRDQAITAEKLAVLEEEHRAYMKSLDLGDHFRRALSLFLIVLLLTAVLVVYVSNHQRALAQDFAKIVGVCILIVVTLQLALILSRPPWHATLIPMTVTAMILTIVYQAPFALMVSFSLALIVSVAMGASLGPLLIQLSGMATAVLLLRDVRSRTRPVEVGILAGAAYLTMTIATEILTHQSPRFIAYDAARHFLWGLFAGFIISGSLPLIERIFGIVTDVSLLELADSSHPLLQELIRRAPGTYNHSMTVAMLAEAAADSIGANSLLTRVGAYYHDIGKMLKPHYFIENQNGHNRHDQLEPALSTLVIIGHVKDGTALAKQYRLPRPIIDFIQQHHGTTLVEYFYREAMRLQEQNRHGHTELEFAFRYPGPKPQTKENGILMLADCAESASRALSSPTPSSIRKLVHDLCMKRLLDGQFDESGLTLTELHCIEESLSKSLIAVYHARIRYPESETRRKAS